jgi:hypothetical protein
VVAAKVWSKVDADERNVSGKPIVITTRLQWLIDCHLRTTLLCLPASAGCAAHICRNTSLWHISPTCIFSPAKWVWQYQWWRRSIQWSFRSVGKGLQTGFAFRNNVSVLFTLDCGFQIKNSALLTKCCSHTKPNFFCIFTRRMSRRETLDLVSNLKNSLASPLSKVFMQFF